MPPEAKVFIAEDDLKVQFDYASALTEGGHTVVGAATTIVEVVNKIHALKESEAQVDVGIVDGCLGYSDSDGEHIVNLLRNMYPSIKIIGASGGLNGVRGADVNVSKLDLIFSCSKLVEAVTEI